MYSKKTGILVVLLLILAALVVFRVVTREEPKRAKELTYKPVESVRVPVVDGEKIPHLIKGETKGGVEKRPYKGVIRNPFQSLYPKTVVVSRPVSPPPAPAPPESAPEQKGPSPAQLESGRIKFIGFLGNEGDRKIFLSRDREVFIVKKGDGISIFEIAEIGDNSVTLKSKDSGEEFKLIIEDVKPTNTGLIPGNGRR